MQSLPAASTDRAVRLLQPPGIARTLDHTRGSWAFGDAGPSGY